MSAIALAMIDPHRMRAAEDTPGGVTSARAEAHRFWAKVVCSAPQQGHDPASICWLWSGSNTFALHDGSKISPRRWAWSACAEEIGVEDLSADVILRVQCGTENCVRPSHMRIVWKPHRDLTNATCGRGHVMDEATGYWAKDRSWVCRVCKRDHLRRMRRARARRARWTST